MYSKALYMMKGDKEVVKGILIGSESIVPIRTQRKVCCRCRKSVRPNMVRLGRQKINIINYQSLEDACVPTWNYAIFDS